jgi:integration host factor subunit beta
MTKKDLINKVQEALKVYAHKDVAYSVNIIFGSIAEALQRGERIEIRGFGNLTIRERKSRWARNPKSGTPVELTERKVAFFKTGKELREMINNELSDNTSRK